MGLKVAVANGNWSNPSTWNGGLLPTTGDVVASNGFTVTIDQNVNVDSITNAATGIIPATPQMTSDTTPSGIVTYSSLYGGYQAWYAFDRNSTTYYLTGNFAPLPQWLSYEFASPKVITNYIIANPSTAASFPKNWTFEAWNGSSWVVLHTVTGVTSAPYSGSFSNTTAYSKYRINITANNGQNNYTSIGELSLFTSSDSLVTSVAGGGFIVSGTGYTITCTSPISSAVTAATPLLTISSTGTNTFYISFNVTIFNQSQSYVLISGAGTVNWIGNINGACSAGVGIFKINSSVLLNIIGNLAHTTGTNFSSTIVASTSNYIINITGQVGVPNGQGAGIVFLNAPGTLNITGNVTGDTALSLGTNTTTTIIGNIIPTNSAVISTTAVIYLKIIGSITAGPSGVALSSTNSSAINIFTGPFISHSSGIQPLYVTRMHYQRTIGSYYEFRNNSTNGALPPAAPAPATRLVSPDTVADSPIPANVRQGRSYALGSQIGTMIVPSPANVVKNVPVDNTVGTGVLDPSALWNVPLSAINTTGSIGQRVKNASTVESTGAQIQTTLNNNP
jgi:hypothetical protein